MDFLAIAHSDLAVLANSRREPDPLNSPKSELSQLWVIYLDAS